MAELAVPLRADADPGPTSGGWGRARAQARSLGLPFEPLEGVPDDPALWSEAPLELLVRFGCAPVGREGARLILAFGDLEDLSRVDELEFLLERPLEAVVAPAEQVAALLRRHRGGEILLEQASEGLRLQFVADDETDAVDDRGRPTESPIVRLVDSLILGAIDRRASDIHIETKDREVLAKYRIDGVLYPALEPLDKRHHETILSRIKVMSELDIAEKRVPQDGRFRLRVKGRTIDFRVSVMPSIYGEDAVIRILDKESLNAAFRRLRLDVLGFSEADLRKLRKYVTEPYGMVVVTGPTGSGKTTTLYAALSEIATPEDKIITIEDPVEYQIPGITQVPVNEKKGLTFARGLRSILRHDPDKIMVGEVRDPETAQIAVQSALTGHLVFTTVHANNVFDVIGRFLHMGVEPYNFVSALNCVMAQRLVRVLCPRCRREAEIAEPQLRESGLDPDIYHDQAFYEAIGCEECGGTGFRGRTAVAELLDMSDRIRQMILERRPAAEIKQSAREEGMTFLRDSALEKVFAGITTLREINKVTFVQ
ncbi:MAG TPA: GspE/PulE family protein [Vicinamibacteria bacterium]|jgi:type II secretory ATPase GspE/PulE/Tfp pilus assembly ATPase PilB-like protein|nr:GspE/PulE family protein [Vicinamibacteria bacterium]